MGKFDRRFFAITGFCLTALMSILLAGCPAGQPQLGREVEIPGTTFSEDVGAYPAPGNLFPDYRLTPGDVLDVFYQIRTWEKKETFKISIDNTVSVKFIHAPELNETQNVKPDGTISLPYIGEIVVHGLTTAQLTDFLKEKYAGILQDPELYVTIPEFRSRIKDLKHDLHTAPRGMSRLVTVRPDGFCTFPLAGDIFAADRTLPDIGRELNRRYEEYFPGLQVDLFLEHHAGSVVYVLGAVNHAGAYKINRPVNLLQAVTLAAGHTADANLDSIIVFRRHGHRLTARRLAMKKALELNENSEFFLLKPDDIVYVTKTGISQASEIMEHIRKIVLFRGWDISLDAILSDDPLIQ